MSDTIGLTGLRDRILSGAGIVRFPRARAPADVRTMALATAAAAVIAGALTWMTAIDTAPATPPAPLAEPSPTPLASSTVDKTHGEVDSLAGLRSDPTLHLDTASVWLPAGGLGILKVPSSPNARIAALPMPAPIVAARNTPETVVAETDDVPLPRAHPSTIATVPMQPRNGANALVATAPEALAPSEKKSGGFFGMIERLFAPQDKKTAPAVLASNPRTAIYGRDGMLAHTYMLGPNGQSNGCVSFKDYDKFLTAYHNGEVEQLIVVPK